MPTNEQRRKAAKRKLERQIERRADRARRRKQRLTVLAVVGVVVVLAGVVGLYFVYSSPDTGTTAAPETSGLCTYTPDGQSARPVETPDANPATSGVVGLTLQTSQGTIPLTLDRAQAPCAVNAVTSLAQQGFYDDTPCPRLVTEQGLQVLQCGDPTGTGSGGPGFRYAQEPPTNLGPSPLAPGQNVANYTRGLVAMANTGQPDSTSSQFFLVYGDSALPPDYTVVGVVAPEGLAVLDRVAAGGQDNSNQAGGGRPTIPVQIQQAQVQA